MGERFTGKANKELVKVARLFVKQFIQRSFFDDDPLVNNDDVVAQRLGLFHVVRGEEQSGVASAF